MQVSFLHPHPPPGSPEFVLREPSGARISPQVLWSSAPRADRAAVKERGMACGRAPRGHPRPTLRPRCRTGLGALWGGKGLLRG